MTAVNFPSPVSLLEPSRVSNHLRSLPATGLGAWTSHPCPPPAFLLIQGRLTQTAAVVVVAVAMLTLMTSPGDSRSSSVGGELLAKENSPFLFFFAHFVLCHKVCFKICSVYVILLLDVRETYSCTFRDFYQSL